MKIQSKPRSLQKGWSARYFHSRRIKCMVVSSIRPFWHTYRYIGRFSKPNQLLSRQKGYAKRLIRGLSRHKRFFHVGRSLLGRHIVDLDWYFDKTKEANRRLDFATAEHNAKQREVLFTATNARNRKAYYFNPLAKANHWLEVIKASSALPYLYKQGVPLVTEGVQTRNNRILTFI